MIELEFKFKLTPEEKLRLLDDATFVKEEEFEDVYYDTANYSLSIQDIWLRQRNGSFLLKIPHTKIDQPELIDALKVQSNSPKIEMSDKQKIKETLHLNLQKSLEDALQESGISPLYRFRNIRKKYFKDGFNIDFDTAIFDDFEYELCEIEVEVPSQENINVYAEKLQAFIASHGLTIRSVKGRLIEYIYQRNPEHYKALQRK